MGEIALDYERLSDVELVKLVARRDPHAVRIITQRNNQRLYRAAWSILKDRAEAEEAVQEAYLKAFAAMDGFEGRSALTTWLTRIVINEALERRRTAERRARLHQEHQIADHRDLSGEVHGKHSCDRIARGPMSCVGRWPSCLSALSPTYRKSFVQSLSCERLKD